MSLPDGRTVPATRKSVRAPFVTMFTVRDGKIVSHRGYWDMAGFIAQLGLMPR
jgi:ketosteroid isomerase-like protein